MTSSTVHPCPLEDLELGKLTTKGISRKSSLNLNHHKARGEDDYVIRNYSSCPSLSAELVESVMCDGQFRYMNAKAQEAAMWCALFSFLILAVGLVIVGLYMALTSM